MGASYFAIRLEHGFQPRIRPPLKGLIPVKRGTGASSDDCVPEKPRIWMDAVLKAAIPSGLAPVQLLGRTAEPHRCHGWRPTPRRRRGSPGSPS